MLADRLCATLGRLRRRASPASALYLVVMVVAGQLLPTVNEVGDFPADTLWYFRRASLLTLATMWARDRRRPGRPGRPPARQATRDAERRELAASL